MLASLAAVYIAVLFVSESDAVLLAGAAAILPLFLAPAASEVAVGNFSGSFAALHAFFVVAAHAEDTVRLLAFVAAQAALEHVVVLAAILAAISSA